MNPTYIKSVLLPHSRLLSCGIEQCVEDKCFYEWETHRPFPSRQMNSRRSQVCANGSICMCLCVNRTLIRHPSKQMCVSGRTSQQTNFTTVIYLSEWRLENNRVHKHSHMCTLAYIYVLSSSGKLELCLLHSH